MNIRRFGDIPGTRNLRGFEQKPAGPRKCGVALRYMAGAAL
jgi:hypothetical protein